MLVEMLVRVVDKIGTTPYKDAGLSKAGDVIVIQESPAPWGSEDLANPDWRIVRLELPGTVVSSLIAVEPGEFAHRQNRKRRYRIKLEDVPAVINDLIAANRDGVTDLTGMSIDPSTLIELKGAL